MKLELGIRIDIGIWENGDWTLDWGRGFGLEFRIGDRDWGLLLGMGNNMGIGIRIGLGILIRRLEIRIRD